MTRLLAPYALPLFGALAFALLAAVGWIVLQGHWLEQAEAERNAALDRINFILTAQGIDADVQNLSDDAFRRELVERLQRDDN
jgi:hypothetical protein